MNGRWLRQAAVAVMILVALSMLWRRENVSAPDAPEQPSRTAPSERTIDFDYYVLVLSWSPSHCVSDEGGGRDDDMQCRSGRPYGFVLHGLWPQREKNYPEFCASGEPGTVADDVMRDVLEVSPSRRLIQHEWDRHGTCSNLSQRAYFAAAKQAYDAIAIPSDYRAPSRELRTTPETVRDAFLAANPAFSARSVAATCRRGELADIWFCLDKTFAPRRCSNDILSKHCGARKVRMRAVRGNWPR